MLYICHGILIIGENELIRVTCFNVWVNLTWSKKAIYRKIYIACNYSCKSNNKFTCVCIYKGICMYTLKSKTFTVMITMKY